MKDYQLSEVNNICRTTQCDKCEFSYNNTCVFARLAPEGWEISPRFPQVIETDNVNHPAHYTSGCGFECFEMLQMVLTDEELCGFCMGNAIKYIWRYQDKGGMEDIRKARWYLEKMMDIQPNYYPDATYGLLWEKVDKMLNKEEETC